MAADTSDRNNHREARAWVDTNILIEAFGLSVLQVDYVRGLGINELKVANSINDYCDCVPRWFLELRIYTWYTTYDVSFVGRHVAMVQDFSGLLATQVVHTRATVQTRPLLVEWNKVREIMYNHVSTSLVFSEYSKFWYDWTGGTTRESIATTQ